MARIVPSLLSGCALWINNEKLKKIDEHLESGYHVEITYNECASLNYI